MKHAPSILRYTLEELQQVYQLSILQAAQIIDRFGGEKRSIDKFMRQYKRREK